MGNNRVLLSEQKDFLPPSKAFFVTKWLRAKAVVIFHDNTIHPVATTCVARCSRGSEIDGTEWTSEYDKAVLLCCALL